MDGIDLLVKNGAVWTPGGFVDADIAVKDGKIAALGKPPVLPDTAAAMIDAKGMKVIPGLIDTHTHHRDPGFTHKEDITTATMAAAAGGVTFSIGMPNVNPPTTTVGRYRALVDDLGIEPARDLQAPGCCRPPTASPTNRWHRQRVVRHDGVTA